MRLPQLRRVRWAVRATLSLGVSASVVANILHAQNNPISQTIAAWPPLALLLTVELISRVPVHRRSLAFARLAATAIIAGIAAWVSYWHMAGVASKYGETGASPYLLPLSVDGLIIVASICLVELAGRLRMMEEQAEDAKAAVAAAEAAAKAATAAARVAGVAAAAPAPGPTNAPTPTPLYTRPTPAPAQPQAPERVPAYAGVAAYAQAPERVAVHAQVPAQSGAPTDERIAAPAQPATPIDERIAARVAGHIAGTAHIPVAPRESEPRPASRPTPAPQQGAERAVTRPKQPRQQTYKTGPLLMPATSEPARGDKSRGTAAVQPSGRGDKRRANSNAAQKRRPVAETAALAAAIEAAHPNISEAEVARQLGITTTRLKAVRRELTDVA